MKKKPCPCLTCPNAKERDDGSGIRCDEVGWGCFKNCDECNAIKCRYIRKLEQEKRRRAADKKVNTIMPIPPKQELVKLALTMTDKEIAEKYDVSVGRVKSWMRKYGILRKDLVR